MAKTRTSSEVKDRYNAKTYDEIKVRVSKGDKETIQTHAETHSESVNGFINRAIEETMERDKAVSVALGNSSAIKSRLPSITYIGRTAKATRMEFWFEDSRFEHHTEKNLDKLVHILSLSEARCLAQEFRVDPDVIEILYEIDQPNDLFPNNVETVKVRVKYALHTGSYEVIIHSTIVEKYTGRKSD